MNDERDREVEPVVAEKLAQADLLPVRTVSKEECINAGRSLRTKTHTGFQSDPKEGCAPVLPQSALASDLLGMVNPIIPPHLEALVSPPLFVGRLHHPLADPPLLILVVPLLRFLVGREARRDGTAHNRWSRLSLGRASGTPAPDSLENCLARARYRRRGHELVDQVPNLWRHAPHSGAGCGRELQSAVRAPTFEQGERGQGRPDLVERLACASQAGCLKVQAVEDGSKFEGHCFVMA